MAGCLYLTILVMFTYVSASPLDGDMMLAAEDSEHVRTMDIRMKGARPDTDDDYLCSSYSMEDLPEDINYIVKFEALADVKVAHHVMLVGCDGPPASDQDVWKCRFVCRHGNQILFAWAQAAPATSLPKDVGFRVGRKSSIKNLVVQIHYKHPFNDSSDNSGIRISLTPKKQKYIAGVYVLFSAFVQIEANTPVTYTDISCKYKLKKPMHGFAFRTHTHSLGRAMTAYVYNGSWYEIGKSNPQWPQAFYPTKGDLVVKPGDKLVSRCIFDSTSRNKSVHFGPTNADEMCNFYIMFYTDPEVEKAFHMCNGNQLPSLMPFIPSDSKKLLPPNPELEEEAKGHHHTMRDPTVSAKKPARLLQDTKWPGNSIKFGEIGGVTTDKEGNVYIFHRASRISITSHYVKQLPIPENTIVVLDKHGHLVKQFGAHRFNMPHGIEVDSRGNIYVTDVNLHQVMRFPKGSTEPDLILGKAFERGAGNDRFCMPTNIAVLASGDFFVADGYCNSRVLKFSSNGTFLFKWGRDGFPIPVKNGDPPGILRLVHSIIVDEEKNLACVADRKNGRIQCYDLEGNFRYIIKDEAFGKQLFSIDYYPLNGGLLYAVNGPDAKVPVQGFTLDVDSGEVLQKWNIYGGLVYPHDIAVDPNHHAVYVVELTGKLTRLAMSISESSIEGNGDPKKIDVSPKNTKKPSLATGTSKHFATIFLCVVLVVPVVILLAVTVVINLRKSGKISSISALKPKLLNVLPSVLGPSHKGFDRLSTHDSDQELDDSYMEIN